MSSGGDELVPNVIQSFEFDSTDLPKLEPYEFHLREELSAPYRLELSLVAQDPSVDESELVGHACTLTLTRGGLIRHINGIVAEATFSGVATDGWTPEGNLPTGLIHLVIVPALELLKQRRNQRIFENAKVPDILKQVLKEALQDYQREVKVKTSKAYPELEYCTQFDETDFAFVRRLMATEGIMSYFKQGEKAEELILFDSADQYVELVTMNHGKVPFETNMQQEHVVETVERFTRDTRLTPTTATVRAFNWSVAGDPDEKASEGKDSLKRERELYLGEAPVGLRAPGDNGVYATTSAEGQVKVIRETAIARTHIASGAGDVSGLSPGVTFDLDNALRNELNRKYLVIEADHHGVRPGNARQGTFHAEVGEVMYTNTFRCVGSDVLYRLETPARRFVQTMQTAVVVGAEDVTTDVHRRIRVQFHWARPGKGKDKAIKSSCWVRVAQASAGIGFGCVFIPRKGQEVVITFLEGDPDKPLVIGSVYNGINTPPYVSEERPRQASTTRSVIRTRSTPNSAGYNEISFEDAARHEELYVQAQKDMDELVKNNHTLTVGNNEVLRVGDDNQGGKTEEGNRTRWVKKDEVIDIGGSRTETVAHSETLNVRENLIHNIDGNRTLNVGKDESNKDAVSITGAHAMSVTKKVTQNFGADHQRDVTGQQTFSAEGKKENIKETYELKTKKLDVTGSEAMKFTQGKTTLNFANEKVDLDAGGTITITQGQVTMTIKDGNVNIKASNGVTLERGGSKVTLSSSSVAVKGSSKVTVG